MVITTNNSMRVKPFCFDLVMVSLPLQRLSAKVPDSGYGACDFPKGGARRGAALLQSD
jgi:hypothetical protein